MANPQPKVFAGWATLKKTAGQTTPAVLTEFHFPISAINPRNPDNIAYPAVINAQGAPSVSVAGKKTPSITLSNIPLKTSWFTGATGLNMLSDFMALATSFLDTNNNSSEYAIGVNDSLATKVYDGCHCTSMSFYQTAPGGGIMMDLSWLAIYGESEKGIPTTVSSQTADAGALLDVTNVDFNNTATDVASWRLTYLRPQGFQMTCDSTLYAATIETGMVGGTFQLSQNANAATVPTTAVTIKIGTTPNGIQQILQLKRDERVYDKMPSLGMQSNSYTLINAAAGYPQALSTY